MKVGLRDYIRKTHGLQVRRGHERRKEARQERDGDANRGNGQRDKGKGAQS